VKRVPADCPACGRPYAWGQSLEGWGTLEVGMCPNGHISPRAAHSPDPAAVVAMVERDLLRLLNPENSGGPT
jgi:hypothetical protein